MNSNNNVTRKVKDSINALSHKGWEEYREFELLTARNFADKILEIAESNNYPRGIMISYS